MKKQIKTIKLEDGLNTIEELAADVDLFKYYE